MSVNIINTFTYIYKRAPRWNCWIKIKYKSNQEQKEHQDEVVIKKKTTRQINLQNYSLHSKSDSQTKLIIIIQLHTLYTHSSNPHYIRAILPPPCSMCIVMRWLADCTGENDVDVHADVYASCVDDEMVVVVAGGESADNNLLLLLSHRCTSSHHRDAAGL